MQKKSAGIVESRERTDMAEKKWIQGMHMEKGALHRKMGIPMGQTIPEGRLRNAARQGGKLGQQARLAITLKGMHK